jgi:hypothetical protein
MDNFAFICSRCLDKDEDTRGFRSIKQTEGMCEICMTLRKVNLLLPIHLRSMGLGAAADFIELEDEQAQDVARRFYSRQPEPENN